MRRALPGLAKNVLTPPLTAAHDEPAAQRASPGLRSVIAGVVVALLVLAALCADLLATAAEVRSLSAQHTQARQQLAALNGLSLALQEAELGLLSHLLTAAPRHLDAVVRSRRNAELQLAEASRLGQAQAPDQAEQAEIERLARMRLEQLDEALSAVRHLGPEAGLALLRGGGGQATLASLRQALDQRETKLAAVLDARTAKANAGLERQQVALPAAAALTIGLLLVASAWLRREIGRRQLAAAALRQANARLADDMAERQRLAEQLRLKDEELERATDRAQSAQGAKSAFLATMSHELRTPLNSIIGFTGILLQELAGPLNPEQRKQLEVVRTSSRHLLALINDVLDLSRIEAGGLKVRSERFDLRAAVERAAAAVRPMAEQKQLALEVALAPALGEAVGDPRRVDQILLNLLGNAVKFTARGAVTVTGQVAGGRACVTVTDTGVGIAADDLQNLFTPFRPGSARGQEGTGLGLVICRRLAELMGGSIAVSSELGKGSVFTLTLPAAERTDG